MKALIEALNIFLKYGDVDSPFICEHERLYVVGFHKKQFTQADLSRLKELGFHWDKSLEAFVSYKYGSA